MRFSNQTKLSHCCLKLKRMGDHPALRAPLHRGELERFATQKEGFLYLILRSKSPKFPSYANVSTHVFAPESLRPEGARYLAQGKRYSAPPWV